MASLNKTHMSNVCKELAITRLPPTPGPPPRIVPTLANTFIPLFSLTAPEVEFRKIQGLHNEEKVCLHKFCCPDSFALFPILESCL